MMDPPLTSAEDDNTGQALRPDYFFVLVVDDFLGGIDLVYNFRRLKP